MLEPGGVKCGWLDFGNSLSFRYWYWVILNWSVQGGHAVPVSVIGERGLKFTARRQSASDPEARHLLAVGKKT